MKNISNRKTYHHSYAVRAHLVGLGNVSTAMDEHAVQHLQHLWLFQYKLRHPHSVGNVAHASQRKQVALCTQDGLPGCQPLLKTSPTCIGNILYCIQMCIM